MRICKLRNLALAAALIADAEGLRADEVIWSDSFEDAASLSAWRVPSGYTVRKGEGVGGSGALVWEESAFRPMPTAPEEEPEDEDNVVRELAGDGRTKFLRHLRVEPGYRYTVSVTLKGTITNNCAYLFFDWYDKDGRRQSHVDAEPTIYREVGRHGWQTITVTSQRMPTEAVSADVYLEVYRTTVGRMCFDDFRMTRDRRRYAEDLFSSAYRDEAAGGTVRFVAPCTLPRDRPPSDFSAKFTFAGAEGEFTLPCPEPRQGVFEATVDVGRLAFGRNPVRADIICDGRTVDSCSMDFTRLREPTGRRVSVDASGLTRVDGKVFFPIGIYVHPKDEEIKYMDRLKGGPFNCVIECAPKAKILNRFHAIGLMTIPKSPKTEERVRQVYGRLRNHPSLLAWYVIDEARPDAALRERPLQAVRKEADPDHPTVAVLNHAENTAPLMGCFDIVARDPYPLSVNCSYPPGSPRKDLLDVAFWPGMMRKYGYGLPPVWQVPQAFAWTWFRDRQRPDLERFPTHDELRSMAWQSIAGGANGILWYGPHQLFQRMKTAEDEAHWQWLVEIAAEIRSHLGFLASEEEPPRVTASTDLLAVRAFRRGGRIAVLVANRTGRAVSGEVRLDDGARISVDLPPFGVDWSER